MTFTPQLRKLLIPRKQREPMFSPELPISARRFENKVACVTGAVQGIGRSTAWKLAREGAKVIIADIAEDELVALAQEMRGQEQEVFAIAGDLSRQQEAERLVRGAVEAYGRVDIAILNVGGTIWFKPLTEYEPEQIEREINRSLWPTIWCAREFAIQMKKQEFGTIVTVGSTITGGGLFRTPYAAAKGGVHALTSALAREASEYNVRVNCVAPGAIDNGVRLVPRNAFPRSKEEQGWESLAYADTLSATPMKKFGTPEEIARAICFLASEEASYITGQVLSVGGGLSG